MLNLMTLRRICSRNICGLVMGLGIRGGRRRSKCDLWRRDGVICNAILYFGYVVIFLMLGMSGGLHLVRIALCEFLAMNIYPLSKHHDLSISDIRFETLNLQLKY